MDISVGLDDHRWSISPDPAEVRIGTPVFWVLHSNRSLYSRLIWKIYFNHGTPFAGLPGPFFATTINRRGEGEALRNLGLRLTQEADHQGAVGPVVPTEPGDYKYGVEVRNAETGEVVGDDDPRLIVLPR
jgi:hypothetical protein